MTEKDWEVEIGTSTAIDLFDKKLADKVLEFNKKYKPFDMPCARLEFRDKVDAAERESERRHGFIVVEEVKQFMKKELENLNLDKYGDEDRFVFIEDQEALQDKVIEGQRTQVVMGHTISYKCKTRSHGISVFIPNKEYEEFKKLKEKK